MSMEMLDATLGLPNDPTLIWDQREEQWKLSGKIYKLKILRNQQKEIKTVYGQLW
jgi:hypothetical protein